MKTLIDIKLLSDAESRFHLAETWCPRCERADLGIVNAKLYLEAGRKYISGDCPACSGRCISEIIGAISQQ